MKIAELKTSDGVCATSFFTPSTGPRDIKTFYAKLAEPEFCGQWFAKHFMSADASDGPHSAIKTQFAELLSGV